MSSPISPMSTASVRQHAVTCTGIAGPWATATGGEPSVAVTESYNGGALKPDLTLGRPTWANLVIDRPFSAGRDRPVIRFIEAALGTAWYATITDQDLDANGIAIGDPVVYTGCVPVKVTGPKFDTEKSDAGRITLEFKVQSKT